MKTKTVWKLGDGDKACWVPPTPRPLTRLFNMTKAMVHKADWVQPPSQGSFPSPKWGKRCLVGLPVTVKMINRSTCLIGSPVVLIAASFSSFNIASQRCLSALPGQRTLETVKMNLPVVFCISHINFASLSPFPAKINEWMNSKPLSVKSSSLWSDSACLRKSETQMKK